MSRILTFCLLMICGSFTAAPTQAGWDPEAERNAQEAIADFKTSNPRLEVFFAKSHGYAVFPEVGKGGLVFGGAHGDGTVYEQGEIIGSSSMTQFTFGLQAGGQTFREIIFFKDKAALERFKAGNFELTAEASAVAVEKSASESVDYSDGVAIFTKSTGGLMFEASIGGQQFSFEPKP